MSMENVQSKHDNHINQETKAAPHSRKERPCLMRTMTLYIELQILGSTSDL